MVSTTDKMKISSSEHTKILNHKFQYKPCLRKFDPEYENTCTGVAPDGLIL